MRGELQVELQEWMGSDAAIANAAWTSTYDKEKREDKYDKPDKVKSIVWRMANEGHAVPFEAVVMRFWIRHPIFSDRQHMTHRIASHNGLSGRYRTLPDDWYKIPSDVKLILEKTHPFWGSEVPDRFDNLMNEQQEFYRIVLDEMKSAEKESRITNSEYKRAREIIRGVIGTASMTERTTIMNLVSFANYQRLRNNPNAQLEIRLIADKMLTLVQEKQICPEALAALKSIGWCLQHPK